jgi:hypothetical protein
MTYPYRYLTYNVTLYLSDMTYRYRYLTRDVSLPVWNIRRNFTRILYMTYRYRYMTSRIVTGI